MPHLTSHLPTEPRLSLSVYCVVLSALWLITVMVTLRLYDWAADAGQDFVVLKRKTDLKDAFLHFGGNI